ncbi:MAG: SH3 domain-containing protein [Crocinitomicaceae bacterium]|nr:SH3 domain-containing protein [Crocinitomicaceae bacterium]
MKKIILLVLLQQFFLLSCTPSIKSVESEVLADIKKDTRNNDAFENNYGIVTEISLEHLQGDQYKGKVFSKKDGNRFSHDVSVTYTSNEFKWEMEPPKKKKKENPNRSRFEEQQNTNWTKEDNENLKKKKSENNKQNIIVDVESKRFPPYTRAVAIHDRVYFHLEPDESTRQNSFIVANQFCTVEEVKNGFGYVSFNYKNKTTKGWLRLNHLSPSIDYYKNNNEQSNRKTQWKIKDPDGYTNVRSDKSSKSPVLFVLYENQHFEVIDNNGNWWKIKHKNKYGYIHNSRVQKAN